MRILVIDGQGGGIGRAVVEKLAQQADKNIEIVALGTNAAATAAMVRAGASCGATGENAIVVNCAHADIIIGVTGIIVADSMLGELTARMAKAVAKSPALKLLIPLNRCNVEVLGVHNGLTVAQLIDLAAEAVFEKIKLCK